MVDLLLTIRPFFTAGAKDYPPTLSAARPEVKELTNLLAALAQARQIRSGQHMQPT